uniref:Uncharacterized protein n=1 Tax=Rhipicephalus zambeziensis TaxID=60191 RepID=A0A224Y709_9ACAR
MPSVQRCESLLPFAMASVMHVQHGMPCQCDRLFCHGLPYNRLLRHPHENCSQSMSHDWPVVDQSRANRLENEQVEVLQPLEWSELLALCHETENISIATFIRDPLSVS